MCVFKTNRITTQLQHLHYGQWLCAITKTHCYPPENMRTVFTKLYSDRVPLCIWYTSPGSKARTTNATRPRMIFHKLSHTFSEFKIIGIYADRIVSFPSLSFRFVVVFTKSGITISIPWWYSTGHVQWNLSITTTLVDTYLPSGAHLGGQGPPRWAPEGRHC